LRFVLVLTGGDAQPQGMLGGVHTHPSFCQQIGVKCRIKVSPIQPACVNKPNKTREKSKTSNDESRGLVKRKENMFPGTRVHHEKRKEKEKEKSRERVTDRVNETEYARG
jgi:hypothetical protein